MNDTVNRIKDYARNAYEKISGGLSKYKQYTDKALEMGLTQPPMQDLEVMKKLRESIANYKPTTPGINLAPMIANFLTPSEAVQQATDKFYSESPLNEQESQTLKTADANRMMDIAGFTSPVKNISKGIMNAIDKQGGISALRRIAADMDAPNLNYAVGQKLKDEALIRELAGDYINKKFARSQPLENVANELINTIELGGYRKVLPKGKENYNIPNLLK
jgi:hypothetical protein